jgi:hypothetical protein
MAFKRSSVRSRSAPPLKIKDLPCSIIANATLCSKYAVFFRARNIKHISFFDLKNDIIAVCGLDIQQQPPRQGSRRRTVGFLNGKQNKTGYKLMLAGGKSPL